MVSAPRPKNRSLTAISNTIFIVFMIRSLVIDQSLRSRHYAIVPRQKRPALGGPFIWYALPGAPKKAGESELSPASTLQTALYERLS
jgi:hypothetical protein